MKHGFGTLIVPGVSKYVGPYEMNQMHGRGVLEDKQLGTYMGDFTHGAITGRGTLRANNGKITTGLFKDAVCIQED